MGFFASLSPRETISGQEQEWHFHLSVSWTCQILHLLESTNGILNLAYFFRFSKLSTCRSRRRSPQTLTDDFVISSGRTWPPWLQLLLMYLVVSLKSKGCCVRKLYTLYRQLNLAKKKSVLSFIFSFFFFSESSSSNSSPEFSRKEYSEYKSLTTLSGISIWTDLHCCHIFPSLSL